MCCVSFAGFGRDVLLRSFFHRRDFGRLTFSKLDLRKRRTAFLVASCLLLGLRVTNDTDCEGPTRKFLPTVTVLRFFTDLLFLSFLVLVEIAFPTVGETPHWDDPQPSKSPLISSQNTCCFVVSKQWGGDFSAFTEKGLHLLLFADVRQLGSPTFCWCSVRFVPKCRSADRWKLTVQGDTSFSPCASTASE